MSSFIDSLDISDVHQENDLNNNIIFILFKSGDTPFLFMISLGVDKRFFPDVVLHSSENGEFSENTLGCPYCDSQTDMYCDELTLYRNELFRRLIQFPSIRLEWLHLPHDAQIE